MSEKQLIQAPEEIRLTEQDEVQEILGNPPSWILQNGALLVALLFLILGTLAWMIKYPEILTARVFLTTETPVIQVKSRINEKIKNLLAQDQSTVEEGEILAILDNTAKREDIDSMKVFLNHLHQKMESGDYDFPKLKNNWILGDMQSTFASLEQNLKDFSFFLDQTIVGQQIRTLNNERKLLNESNTVIRKQRLLAKQQVDLAESNFERGEQELVNGAISSRELEARKTLVLNERQKYEQLAERIKTNELSMSQKEREIDLLRQERYNEIASKTYNIENNINVLKEKILAWEQNFLVKAPASGRLAYNSPWSVNQTVDQNQILFSVIPPTQNTDNSGNTIIARGFLPAQRSGKVKDTMLVNIRLDNYPYKENGVLQGRISYKAPIPNENGNYQIRIELPQELVTTSNKAIEFEPQMPGTAHIITEDRRIIQVIYNELSNIFKDTYNSEKVGARLNNG